MEICNKILKNPMMCMNCQTNFCKKCLYKWCEDYVNSGGTLETGDKVDPRDPDSIYPWTPENQDKIAEFILTGYYNKYHNWHDVAVAWNGGEGSVGESWSSTETYWQKICNVKPGGMPPKVINLVVLLQLVLVSIMLLYFGSRLHKLIIDQFGSMGFKFTNEV